MGYDATEDLKMPNTITEKKNLNLKKWKIACPLFLHRKDEASSLTRARAREES